MTSLNVPVEWVALVLHEGTDSKLSPDAGYPDRYIRGIYHTPQKKNTLKSGSLTTPSASFSIFRPQIVPPFDIASLNKSDMVQDATGQTCEIVYTVILFSPSR
jgi:hypothetical protein